MLEAIRKRLMKNDEGVSPVVGTILMIAATVAIGATVFTAVNAFGSDTVQEPVDAVFSARAVDTDDDGKTDVIKVTYVSGPTLLNTDTTVSVASATGSVMKNITSATKWTAGDFRIYDLRENTAAEGAPPVWVNHNSAGTWLVTISARDVTVLDTAITLDA